MSLTQRFDERCQQILLGLWEEEPVEATALGIATFDALLPRADARSRARYHEQRAHFLAGLQEFVIRKAELDLPHQLDLELLISHLETGLFSDERFRLHERSADRYPADALYGVYYLLMRESRPLDERLAAVARRLREVPRLLAEGMENLRQGTNIPRIWTEIAIEIADAGTEFYSVVVPSAAAPSKKLKHEVAEASATALSAMREYGDFLQHQLLPRCDGSFAIGEDAFNFLLRERHHLPYSARELRDIGNDMVRETRRELEVIQHKIALGRSWRDIVADLKRDHPPADGILDSYREQMDLVRQFVEEHEIATIPTGQELRIVETPAFQRGVVPYAAFIPPAPFEEKQEGFFWVTPVSEIATPEAMEEQLAGHCRWSIPVTALHEAYPGHHLQFCRANRVESPVRRCLGTPVFVEGWALYCESMMREEGFLSDPRAILMQLKDQLWRACRVVIDVGLHCFGMSFDAAVSMLVSVADLERGNAVAEVKRYTQTPTQPMSYLIGKHEILALRDDYRARAGAAWNLREFHDRLLSWGSIPVEMVRRAMLQG